MHVSIKSTCRICVEPQAEWAVGTEVAAATDGAELQGQGHEGKNGLSTVMNSEESSKGFPVFRLHRTRNHSFQLIFKLSKGWLSH